MGIKQGLYSEYLSKQEEDEKQVILHEKHQEIAEDVKIVEKPMAFKFILSFMSGVVTWIARILLVILTGVGIISLLYPDTRAILYQVLMDTISNITGLLGI